MIGQENNRNMTGGDAGMFSGVGVIHESMATVIWRNRWIILLTTSIALAATYIYVNRMPSVYTSTARIYVEQSGPKVFTETEQGVMTQSKNYLYTQAALLTSNPIITDVLENLDVEKMKTFAQRNNRIAYLKSSINVVVGKQDDIISVSLDSPYPQEAAETVNAIVRSYRDYNARQKKSSSAEVLTILRDEKAKLDKELVDKQRVLMEFRSQNSEFTLEGEKGSMLMDRLEKLSSALTEAILKTVDAKSLYESTKAMASDPDRLKQFVEARRASGIDVSIGNEKAELERRLQECQLRRQDCLRQVTVEHPAIKALDREIEQIETELAGIDSEFAQAQLSMVEQEYLAAKEKEDQISKYYEEQREHALTLNEQIAKYVVMQSDLGQTKDLCNVLNDRIKQLDVTEDVGALNISVLEDARPAGSPSGPDKARYLTFAIAIGLMLGAGLAVLRDLMDQTLRSAEEISNLVGVPVLGTVPEITDEESGAARAQKVHLDPDSPVAEAYRTIRTAVLLGVPNGKAKTILVTSPKQAEGKTTMVSNLATAMAQAGQRTLILDADFRNPMQHLVFPGQDNEGFIQLLSGNMDIQQAVQITDVKGLELLACKAQLMNASEVLNSKAFARLLDNLCARYDRIIIDSPPVLPVTDAQILGAICDVTLLVLRADNSTRKACRHAYDSLSRVGGRVLGVVVNNVSSKSRYAHSVGYGYDNVYFGQAHQGKKVRSKPAAV